MAFSPQRRRDLRNSLAQVETDAVGISYGQGEDGMLDAELLHVWFGQSGTVFKVNLSVLKILALIGAMFRMDSYTATMATRLDLASFFPHYLGCTQGMEINLYFKVSKKWW